MLNKPWHLIRLEGLRDAHMIVEHAFMSYIVCWWAYIPIFGVTAFNRRAKLIRIGQYILDQVKEIEKEAFERLGNTSTYLVPLEAE